MKLYIYYPEQEKKEAHDESASKLTALEGWYSITYLIDAADSSNAKVSAFSISNPGDYGHIDKQLEANTWYCHTNSKTLPRKCCCLRAPQGPGFIPASKVKDNMRVLKDDTSDDQVALDAANLPSVDTVMGELKSQLLQTTHVENIVIKHEPAMQSKVAEV